MEVKFVTVHLRQDGNVVSLKLPFVPDRVFEIIKDGLLSQSSVTFDSLFNQDLD